MNFSRVIAGIGVVMIASACAETRPTAGDGPATGASSAAVQQATGLDRLPRPAEVTAFDGVLRRHLRDLPPTDGDKTVLVDVDVDARGLVTDVRGVRRPDATGTRAVLVDDDGSSHELVVADDPAYLPAVQAALRETRFHPAIRDGRPVAFTLRMTVSIPAT